MKDRVIDTLTNLFNVLGVHDVTIDRSVVAGQQIYSISGPEQAKQFLHANADSVHSMEHIIKKILERSEESTPLFVIDVDGRRVSHIKDLETRAHMMAERAKSFQYDVELAPMSAYDRLVIHTALQDTAHIKTESQGEGRSRRIVIKYTG